MSENVNKPTSIRADEWYKVADAVKRGECEVWASENDKVIHVRQSMPSGRLIATLYESLDGTKSQNIVFNTDTFTVRWNDTPPASEPAVDAEMLQWLKRQPVGKLVSMSLEHLASLALEGDKASEPAVDAGEIANAERRVRHKMWLAIYEIAWRKQQDSEYTSEPMSYEEYLEYRANDALSNLITTQRQLAAAGDGRATIDAVIIELVEELNWKARTDHRTLAIDALRAIGISNADIIGYFEGNIILQADNATPPPAPAVSALVEAVQPFLAIWWEWNTNVNAGKNGDMLRWLFDNYYCKAIEADYRKLAAAAALAEQGGEGA